MPTTSTNGSQTTRTTTSTRTTRTWTTRNSRMARTEMETVRHTCGWPVKVRRLRRDGQDEAASVLWCQTCCREVSRDEIRRPVAVCAVQTTDTRQPATP